MFKRESQFIMLKRLASFFWGSMAGVTLDVAMFQTLSFIGVGAVWCNMASSSLAVATTYFMVTRYTYSVAASPMRFAGFATWYAGSIICFSWLIGFAVAVSGWAPLLCKLLSLPLSFAVNFLFSQFFLGKVRHV